MHEKRLANKIAKKTSTFSDDSMLCDGDDLLVVSGARLLDKDSKVVEGAEITLELDVENTLPCEMHCEEVRRF